MNWRDIIMDIKRAGLSCPEIARQIRVRGVDCAPTTINGLFNEEWNEPRYSLGVALIDLRDRLSRAGLLKVAA